MLWTRLALEPLAENGLGGMPSRPYAVQWQVATDDLFRHVVKAGVAVARPEHGHAVHVTVEGLRPGREYWYRFRTEGHLSRAGRSLTAPARGTTPRELAMSFVSCSQFEHGWFTAYRRLAEDRPDLVLHLGDYQYEYTKNTYVAPGGNVRDHEGPETTTLATYRQRHAQDKTDPDLQEAHLVAPFTSGGDGADSASGTHPWLKFNPHLRFQNSLRGYVNTTITREWMEADFRCVRKVKTKDAEVFTRASFAIADRQPGLHQTADNPPAPAAARSLSIGDDAGVTADTIAWETARP